jgi:cysteine desulfurase
MHANNETGCVQPVAEVARLARDHGALLHCDAVQSLGRIPFDPRRLGCDSAAFSAHKFGGPKGCGALYLRAGVELDPLLHGGNQEGLRRAGTENIAAAAAMAFAARRAAGRLEQNRRELAALEAVFLAALRPEIPELEINGAADDKIPGVVNLSVPGLAQDDLVVGMDLAGFAISAGSACSSGVIEPSHVLMAMGLDRRRVDGAIRISFGAGNDAAQAAAAASALAALCRRLQEAAPAEEAS